MRDNRKGNSAGFVNVKGDNDGKDTGENPVADQHSDFQEHGDLETAWRSTQL